MIQDYKILGLEPGADEKQIKQAYFKLVRQYPPEKDPDMFQKIRAAYERLKEHSGESKISLEFPDDPYMQIQLKQIEEAQRTHNPQMGIEAAETALEIYGETEGILYYLGNFQLEAGYSGKAVKTFERLTEMKPEKLLFEQLLACAYYMRGYVKKAYEKFFSAYEAGGRERRFLQCFTQLLIEKRDGKNGLMVIRSYLAMASEGKNDLEDMLEAYYRLLYFAILAPDTELSGNLTRFLGLLEQNSHRLKQYEDDLKGLVRVLLDLETSLKQKDKGRKKSRAASKGLQPDRQELIMQCGACLDTIRQIPGKDFQQWLEIEKCDVEMDMLAGMNLSREIFGLCMCNECFAQEYDSDELEGRRFLWLNCMLLCLERYEEFKPEFDKIRDAAPVLYGHLKPDFEKLGQAYDTNRVELLRSQLLKDFDRLYTRYDGCTFPGCPDYYKVYPNRKQQMHGTVSWESIEEGTYVREAAKIGRNDPCPCGSGKKYKRCCGR